MDPTSLLAQLRDVHEPTIISWWPLAYGWWVLIVLTLIFVITSITILVRWYKRTACLSRDKY